MADQASSGGDARGRESSDVAAEIASQPECWSLATRRASQLGDILPASGDRVLALGCGTSYYIAKSYAGLREAHGLGTTDAATASELPVRRSYDAVLAISRSGTTTEVVRALDGMGAVSTVAIVGDQESPVARRADRVVALEFAAERSIVQTRFATSTLALLRAHLLPGGDRMIADARRALSAPIPKPNGDLEHLVMLGQRWTVGLAEEAALKYRETAGGWAEAYPAMEYRHGPISAATERTLVWSFDALPKGLRPALEAAGVKIEVGVLDPLAELIRVQRQAVVSALRCGRNPDAPANLERSVILR
jgi:fructoselysine-6-P-deglycase FrlB-like protein